MFPIVAVGRPLHYISALKMAILLPKGKMEQPLSIAFKMADVIAKWQMELPLRLGDVAW